MGFTERGTPVTSSYRDNRQFCEDDRTADGGSYFLRTLDTESDVPVKVTNGNESFESSTLTGTSLLLDGHNFHDFILEFGKEEVDDLIFFDREGEEVDFLH